MSSSLVSSMSGGVSSPFAAANFDLPAFSGGPAFILARRTDAGSPADSVFLCCPLSLARSSRLRGVARWGGSTNRTGKAGFFSTNGGGGALRLLLGEDLGWTGRMLHFRLVLVLKEGLATERWRAGERMDRSGVSGEAIRSIRSRAVPTVCCLACDIFCLLEGSV